MLNYTAFLIYITFLILIILYFKYKNDDLFEEVTRIKTLCNNTDESLDEVTRLKKENGELKEQLKSKNIYLVLQLLDEGYDSVQTEIKLITFDEEKAKKTAEEYVKVNKKETNLEYQIEIWENEKYLDTIFM